MKTPEQMAEEYCNTKQLSYVERLVITKGFIDGYQAAMNSLEKPDSCEHILHKEKMVDVNSSNNSSGWINVYKRMPKEGEKVMALINYVLEGAEIREVTEASFRNGLWSGEGVHITHPLVSHWMPLPNPPEDD